MCLGTACYVKGSQQVIDKFCEILKIKPGETTEDGEFTIDALRCIGACGVAPAVSINGEFIQKRPIFQSVDAELRAVVGHWKKATQEKEIVWTAKSDLDAWNRDHSMHWNSSVFPLEIGKQHRISMNGFNLDVVKSVADRLPT